MNSHSGKHPPVKKGYCLFFHCGPKQQVAYQQKDKGHDPDNTQIPFLFKKTEYVEESKKQKGRSKRNAPDLLREEAAQENVSFPLPGEPIPNPLPGPKKHIPKEMDYAFEPDAADMRYDIENLEEADDFDLL